MNRGTITVILQASGASASLSASLHSHSLSACFHTHTQQLCLPSWLLICPAFKTPLSYSFHLLTPYKKFHPLSLLPYTHASPYPPFSIHMLRKKSTHLNFHLTSYRILHVTFFGQLLHFPVLRLVVLIPSTVSNFLIHIPL